jgi:hypothetical protein
MQTTLTTFLIKKKFQLFEKLYTHQKIKDPLAQLKQQQSNMKKLLSYHNLII